MIQKAFEMLNECSALRLLAQIRGGSESKAHWLHPVLNDQVCWCGQGECCVEPKQCQMLPAAWERLLCARSPAQPQRSSSAQRCLLAFCVCGRRGAECPKALRTRPVRPLHSPSQG